MKEESVAADIDRDARQIHKSDRCFKIQSKSSANALLLLEKINYNLNI